MRLIPISSDFLRSAPDWPNFSHFTYFGFTADPQDHWQGLIYIILTCRVQWPCPFIVNPSMTYLESPFAAGARAQPKWAIRFFQIGFI